MSTITLPNIRVGSDLQVRVRLKDGGVAIDWSTLSNIKACIYSDAQRALAGRCAFSIDEEDNTLLVCTYAANKPQYLGVNRIVISAKYMGETKTYDKPAFSFVRWTADQEGEEITIDDPDVDVEIDVEDISSSILQEAVDAAFTAADRANDAAEAAEHMVDIHTGPKGAKGDKGDTGEKGDTGDAAGFGTVSAALQEDGGDPSVVVAASGPDTAKQFDFTFKNLKGDKGDKGDQGNSGYQGAAGELEVVNNLTDGGSTAALSAEMGKTLEGEVSQLEAKVDEISDTLTIDVTGTGTFQVGRLLYSSVNPQSIYPNYTAYRYQLFNAKKGDVITYKSMADTGTAILGVQNANDSTKYNSLVAGIGTSNYVEGTYTVPSDNVYCICGYNNKETVASITRIGRIPALEGKVQEMDTDFSQSIQSLEENVNTIKREIGIYPMGENLIGLCSVEDGKYINYNGGVMSLAGYSIYSLPVENATQIKNKGAFGLNTAIGFFSSDILSASSLVEIHKYSDYNPQDTYYTEEITLNVPVGAKFFAFTIRTDSVSGAYVKASQIVNEKGSINARISTLEEGASAFFIDPELHLEGITDNPLALIKKNGGLASAFESWGFIGDSLASGEIWGWKNVQKTLVASENNKMVDDSGDIVDASGYIISEPLQGQIYKPKFVVEFASNTGLSSSMCIIARCDASGNILAVGAVGSTATKYTFSVADNQYVVVCYPSGNIPSVRCVSNFVQDNYDISWGQYMCRICGAVGVNYSVGGGTAKKFVLGQSPFNSTNSLAKLKSDTQKQAFILAFGVNDKDNAIYDANVTDIEDIGADVNLADPSQNANTFAGYYARAIQEIKTAFQDSFIFLVTIPESSWYDEMNTIIRAMPGIFENTYNSIYVLDLKEYLPASAVNQFRMNGIHFNAQGYVYFAYAFCTYIDWLIRTYPNNFKGVSLIGKALLNNPT